jgi:hypothetical protein
MKIILIIIVFILINGFLVVSNNNLPLNSPDNAKTFCHLCFGWISTIADNTSHITNYAIKLDWIPQQ